MGASIERMTTKHHANCNARRHPLTEDDLQRLLKVMGMLGSIHTGERAAAAWQVSRMVRQSGLSWSDLLSGAAPAASPYGPADFGDSAPVWRQVAARCRREARRLSA
jgi:hypothetical protein